MNRALTWEAPSEEQLIPVDAVWGFIDPKTYQALLQSTIESLQSLQTHHRLHSFSYFFSNIFPIRTTDTALENPHTWKLMSSNGFKDSFDNSDPRSEG